ncbi:kinesin-like protein KIF15 [Selaginella moellendorffii]|uniref:kinesin-like protein KIF15 n=1 Tax=Selaginella moellendorffii TaxID=88036 RepID=UPI000D1C54B8|nr:kinesin-like protein KIF15 [Selaginella moellendorffii]|eukprot:XP_024516891.1 kinesin-like protein KIF15 [Selaginella moellendorffii]
MPASNGGIEIDGDGDAFSAADQPTNSNVQVVVRVRPPNQREHEQGYKKAAAVDAAAQTLTLSVTPFARSFKFDYVADEDVGQEDIFQRVGKPITDACLQGYHCCLIAYGQTGAGKTFTMEGLSVTEDQAQAHEMRGLIPRILDYMFQRMGEEKKERQKDVEYGIKCSYLQIYNEQVQDLLDPDSAHLNIREDTKNGMYVDGLQEVVVPSAEATYGVFRRGSQNRHVGMTAMNIESSRSHSVFTLVVESQRVVGGVMNRKTSRFYLVDLAGSERQKYSETIGIRLKEAGSINKSLSALGNVIKALVDISEGKVRHVPYRDSKLTFLLKDALGGNSKCTLIANVSPADKNGEETLSTLKFAQRAKLMRNAAVVNEDMLGNPAIMGEEIKRLRLEIATLRANIGAPSLISIPTVAAEALPESERISRLEHILSESTKQSLAAERKSALELHELATKYEAAQAVCERLETALQSQKMITRLRECAIKRVEGGRPATDGDDGTSEMKEEIEQLRKQVEHHPDVVRFKMELDLCKAKLEEYEHKDKGEEHVAQLENYSQTLKLELQDTLEEKAKLDEAMAAMKAENESARAQVLVAEEQFLKLQEAAEKCKKEATEAIQKQEKTDERLREAIQEQDRVWRMCNLAEAQATELALELAKEKSDASKALQKEKEILNSMVQVISGERDEAARTSSELATKLDIALAANALLESRIRDLEGRLVEKRRESIS